MNRLKQLGKDTIIYGVGGILAKSTAFLTLPIFTRVFSPTEYGIIEMLVVLSSFLSSILVMGMDSAQSMYFFKVKDDGQLAQAKVVTAILQWRLIWGSFIVIVASFLAPLLNVWFFEGKLSWEYFAVTFASTLFTQIMYQSAEVLRLLHRAWEYIIITLSQSIFSTIVILSLVLLFDQGIIGYFTGTLIASILMSIFGWFKIRDYITFRKLHTDLWPQLVRFGAPLVPAGMSIYFMSTADRWFIQYFHGSDALGLFAVGAKFALLMALVVETFRKAWWPIAMDAMHSNDGPETFRLIARLYVGFGTAAVILLTLLSPTLVQWLTPPAFHSSWPIVGILAWKSLLYGFFLIASAGIWKAEKTYLNLYLMGSAAVFGLFLNWMLVPSYGAQGAALATVITYFAWTVASMILSEKLWLVGFPVKLFLFQVFLGGCLSSWFVLTDSTMDIYLKSVIGISMSILIVASCLSKATYTSIRKRIESI